MYQRGIKLAQRFCKVNDIPEPQFVTYKELLKIQDGDASFSIRFAKKVMPDAKLVGAHTGLYHGDIIFVNVDVTALPVQSPGQRRWSWPCWKTDRTAVGVVAHEMGHYVEDWIAKNNGLNHWGHHNAWISVLLKYKKKVSSYEPRPWEAWAETMRLFILNPQLLAYALPHRYDFIEHEVGLKRSEKRDWYTVLANPEYNMAAERWIHSRHG